MLVSARLKGKLGSVDRDEPGHRTPRHAQLLGHFCPVPTYFGRHLTDMRGERVATEPTSDV